MMSSSRSPSALCSPSSVLNSCLVMFVCVTCARVCVSHKLNIFAYLSSYHLIFIIMFARPLATTTTTTSPFGTFSMSPSGPNFAGNANLRAEVRVRVVCSFPCVCESFLNYLSGRFMEKERKKDIDEERKTREKECAWLGLALSPGKECKCRLQHCCEDYRGNRLRGCARGRSQGS